MESNKLVRAYILDDDPSAIALLSRLLGQYSVDIVGTASDATPLAIDDITEKEPDLLFLDVELPSSTGLEFWSAIRPGLKPETKVVFYTGYDKYLLDALRRQAFDYMLKPAMPSELAQIMTRFYEQKLSAIPHASPHQNVMLVSATGEHTVLRFECIAFFRFSPERKLWEVVCTDGNTYDLRHKSTADTILNYSPLFVQIHKRYIVNTNHIDRVVDNLCVLSPPLDQLAELRISKNYRHRFMTTFYNM